MPSSVPNSMNQVGEWLNWLAHLMRYVPNVVEHTTSESYTLLRYFSQFSLLLSYC